MEPRYNSFYVRPSQGILFMNFLLFLISYYSLKHMLEYIGLENTYDFGGAVLRVKG